MAPPLRIGLALGAGGVVGASYLVGALLAIEEATGWETGLAAQILGTSAGAFVAAIEAAGVPPALTYARCTGEPFDQAAYPADILERSAEMDRHNEGPWFSRYPPRTRALSRPALASPKLLRHALGASLAGKRTGAIALGLLGEGWLSNVPSIGGVIRTGLPTGWATAPLWVVALDLDRGERVVLGAPGYAKPDLHVAISAATAVPGVFAPVKIDGRRHCDAGLYSPANLDVFAGLGLDAVVCINPLTGPAGGAPRRRIMNVVQSIGRTRWTKQLAAEQREVEAHGTRVYILEPSAEDRAHFPPNPMDLSARADVMRRARATTTARLAHDANLGPLVTLLRRHAETSRRVLEPTHAQESL